MASSQLDAARSLMSGLPAEMRHSVCQASELGRRLRGRLRSEPVPTTMLPLDRLLGGGLPKGVLVELVGRGSCGRFATLLATVAAATGSGETAALVDLGSHLDPQSAIDIGVDLHRLLWVRPRRLPEALAAAETLVHTGFALVAVDLGLPPVPGRAPVAALIRLARSATAHSAVVLLSTPYRLSGCAATVVVSTGQGRGRWAGTAGSPRLLEGLHTRFTVARQDGRRPGESAEATLAVPEAVSDGTAAAEHERLEPGHAEAL